MKKKEMIEYLNDKGIDVPEKWSDLQRLYFETVRTQVKTPINPHKTPIKVLTKMEKLNIKREVLYPQIKKIVGEMKGQVKATGTQVKELFRLYNAYYLRNDNPSCNVCLVRVYTTFIKLIKIKG